MRVPQRAAGRTGFPTRRDLFEAYGLHMEGARHDAVADAHPPASIAEVAPVIRRFFQRFDDEGDPTGTMRRLRPSVAWAFSREVTVPSRRAWAGRMVDAEFPGLSTEDRARFCDLVVRPAHGVDRRARRSGPAWIYGPSADPGMATPPWQ